MSEDRAALDAAFIQAMDKAADILPSGALPSEIAEHFWHARDAEVADLRAQLASALAREAVKDRAVLEHKAGKLTDYQFRDTYFTPAPAAEKVWAVFVAAVDFALKAAKKERDDPYGDGVGTVEDLNAVGQALTDIRAAVDRAMADPTIAALLGHPGERRSSE